MYLFDCMFAISEKQHACKVSWLDQKEACVQQKGVYNLSRTLYITVLCYNVPMITHGF